MKKTMKAPIKWVLRNLVILLSPLFILSSSCGSYVEPEFKYIRNIKIGKFDKGEIELHADAVMYNPNKMSITVTEIDMEVVINGIEVNKIHQLERSKVKGRKDFTVPLSITFPTKKLFDNFVSAFLYASQNRKLDVEYKGVIRMRTAGIVNFKVPIDYKGEINLAR